MAKKATGDKFLTIQIFKDHLNPRSFRVPAGWVTRISILAWLLLVLTAVSSLYAIKEYFSERAARPALVSELENEVQQLKIALEKRQEPSAISTNPTQATPETRTDFKATETKPTPGPGIPVEGKEGVWSGLAEGVTAPPPGTPSTIKLEDARLDWQGKFANFYAGVVFNDPGKGSQQGHIIVLARGTTRIITHPDGVLNLGSGDHLFNPARGEYFSVSRFRPLKTHIGPFDSPSQLNEVQVYVFDLTNKLILLQTFKYGNK